MEHNFVFPSHAVPDDNDRWGWQLCNKGYPDVRCAAGYCKACKNIYGTIVEGQYGTGYIRHKCP